MKRSNQYTRRRTAAQWHQIVEAQQASDLTAPKYCQEKQISYLSFINWKKKLMDASPKPDKKQPTFIQLTPEPDLEVSTTDMPDVQPLLIELDLGAGVSLRISRAS